MGKIISEIILEFLKRKLLKNIKLYWKYMEKRKKKNPFIMYELKKILAPHTVQVNS